MDIPDSRRLGFPRALLIVYGLDEAVRGAGLDFASPTRVERA